MTSGEAVTAWLNVSSANKQSGQAVALEEHARMGGLIDATCARMRVRPPSCLASGGEDCVVRLWGWTDGAPLAVLAGFNAPVECMISRDVDARANGRAAVAVATLAGEVSMWAQSEGEDAHVAEDACAAAMRADLTATGLAHARAAVVSADATTAAGALLLDCAWASEVAAAAMLPFEAADNLARREFECPVCLGAVDTDAPCVQLACGHALHAACALPLIGERCPLCRALCASGCIGAGTTAQGVARLLCMRADAARGERALAEAQGLRRELAAARSRSPSPKFF